MARGDGATTTRALRVGILTGTPAVIDDGALWLNHSNARTFEALRARFAGARLLLPRLSQRHPSMNHALAWPKHDIAFLPPLATTISAQRHYLAVRRAVRRFADGVDALFVRAPFQLPSAIRALGKPMVVHVVSNPADVVRSSTDYAGIWRWAANTFAAYSEHSLATIAREPAVHVATNGDEMWRKLAPRAGRVVVSSCLKRAEMRPRGARRPGPPRLLFVGYLRPEKGVDVLVDAFERLRRERPMTLTLVGDSDRKTTAGQRIDERIASSPFATDIVRTGMIDFGEPLFDLYRDHDVLVLPSLSEGTPRTLVEARCFGCPVVATRVGGIPSSVTDGDDGLLVPPRDPAALAAAIARVLDDDTVRARLVATGLAGRDRFSLEHFADELADEIVRVAEARG